MFSFLTAVFRAKSGRETYFDAGGLVVFPFSSDCIWFSRASKRLLGAFREESKDLN